MPSRRLSAGAAALAVLGAGCAPRASATVTGEVAHVGHLQIVHPYLPDPASPSVAAVYLTVRNTGSTPDRLVSVTSPLAPVAMLMTEDDTAGTGGSTGTMAPLDGLAIPGHGAAALVPGHDHVMLERPAGVKVGQDVRVTLHFARAGSVTVEVPVVPLVAIVDNDSAPIVGGS
jgi:copper(I)-binding protein